MVRCGEESDKVRYGREDQKLFPDCETKACAPRLARYCVGTGLDLGCGTEKIRGDAIGIDLHNSPSVDIVADIRNLSMFEDQEMDYVFSSHALEDVPDPVPALREWKRVLKVGGNLCLYMPDKEFYYNVGHPKANQAHTRDYCWQDIQRMLDDIGGFETFHTGRYGPVYLCGEWSYEICARRMS